MRLRTKLAAICVMVLLASLSSRTHAREPISCAENSLEECEYQAGECFLYYPDDPGDQEAANGVCGSYASDCEWAGSASWDGTRWVCTFEQVPLH